jgi:hypothetical protein
MGKNGKQRKRCRLEHGSPSGAIGGKNIFSCLMDNDDDDNNHGPNGVQDIADDASDEISLDGDQINVCQSEIEAAVRLLFILSKDVDYFRSKKMKAFRTEVFPLLTLQKTAYFEPEVSTVASDEELNELKEARSLKTLSKVVNHFAGSDAGRKEFLSSESKMLRRSLYPLVVATVCARSNCSI